VKKILNLPASISANIHRSVLEDWRKNALWREDAKDMKDAKKLKFSNGEEMPELLETMIN